MVPGLVPEQVSSGRQALARHGGGGGVGGVSGNKAGSGQRELPIPGRGSREGLISEAGGPPQGRAGGRSCARPALSVVSPPGTKGKGM